MSEGTQQGDYTSRDFELDDLTPTDQIPEHVGCSEEVAREWLFKLEDEGELDTMPKGNKGLVWVRK